MRTTKTRTTLVAIAGTAVLALVALGTSLPAADAVVIGPAGNPVAIGSGTLTLTGSAATGTMSVAYSGTSTVAPQTISAKNCVSSVSGTEFLTFAATGPDVNRNTKAGLGLKDLSLGVRSGNDSNGTSCKQVNQGTNPQESLTIALNPAAFGTSFGFPAVHEAGIDLNLAGNAVITAELKRQGNTIGLAELQSGFSAPQPQQDARSQLQACRYDSNSGPQSGFNNNCYWEIEPLSEGGYVGGVSNPTPAQYDWDTIVLTAVVGQFSIQGGNSWPTGYPAAAGTRFGVTAYSDGTLGCYDGTPATLAAAQASAFGDDRAVITRLVNGKVSGVTPECVLKPYTYSDTSNTSAFRQDIRDGQSTAQFAAVLPRDYTKAEVTSVAHSGPSATAPWPPLPTVSVNWEDGTSDVTLTYCVPGLITATDATNYKVPTVDSTKVVSALDQTLVTPATQYACIYAQTNQQNPDGSVTAYDYIYFMGDILLKGGR